MPRIRKADRESGDLQVLRTIAEALNAAPDVGDALTTTLDQVTTLLGLDAGWIWLIDPQTGRFYSAAARHLPPFLREPLRMTGQTCWCLRAFKSGELTAGNIDVMECSRLRGAVAPRDRAGTHGLRYHASIPLYFADRPLGIMNVAAPAWRRLTVRELDLLSTIALQVGVAIERARLAGESIASARIEERSRLAREIHDTLAQSLTAIGLQIETALASTPPAAAAPLHRALELSRSALDRTRDSIRALRSAGVGPLPEALSGLAHAVAAESGVRVHVRTGGASSLTVEQEQEVIRIVTEALTNVRKHARATDVHLSLSMRGGGLRLEIADNGRGFRPRAASSGFGLVGMRERAANLGGRLTIAKPTRGTGTRVILTISGRGGAR